MKAGVHPGGVVQRWKIGSAAGVPVSEPRDVDKRKMKTSQKAKNIILVCILSIGICSGIALLKGLRPTEGLPYEKLTMEQAMEYMEYEEGYILVDVGTAEQYASRHIPGAVNLPYDTLVSLAAAELPDKSRMIYIYDRKHDREDKACRKLCEMGYTSITCIGKMDEWQGEFEGIDA